MADGMLSLAWNNHSSTFCHMLSTVRDAELYTDVTIACDGKFYPAHKLVLSTCSDYFHKIFERTPCKHPVIVIKGVECKNMEALLNYMYAGVVNVSQSDLAQLIRAAELLEIKGLAVPDEPPISTKRPVQTRDTSVDSSSSSLNPKRSRQDEKRTLNKDETPCSDSSVASAQSLPLRKDDSMEEQTNGYDMYNNKVNQRQSLSEHRQERKDSLSCSNRRSEQLGTDHDLDHLNPAGSQNEVASEGGIKEEKIELDSECEGSEIGFEYESLVTDLVGDGGGGGAGAAAATKENPCVAATSFAPSLSAESYSTEAGPSGLQPWPVLGESGEGAIAGQGYTGGLPLASHVGQQPHQMQHMVRKVTDGEDTGRGQVSGTMNNLTTADKRYQCPSCEYATNNSSCFTRHLRTHTGEKPFPCPYCPVRCTRRTSLLAHIQCHTGETPLTCTYCPYVSRQKSNLNRHIKRYHKHTETESACLSGK